MEQNTTQLQLRDYFIAHAPTEPQPWFKPVMPSARPFLYIDEDGKEYKSLSDADQYGATGKVTTQNEEDVLKWDSEYTKRRYVQWPAAWADEMIAQQGEPKRNIKKDVDLIIDFANSRRIPRLLQQAFDALEAVTDSDIDHEFESEEEEAESAPEQYACRKIMEVIDMIQKQKEIYAIQTPK